MKAHGVHQGSGNRATTPATSSPAGAPGKAKRPAAKKRKTNPSSEDEDENEDTKSQVKKEVKAETKKEKKMKSEKAEGSDDGSLILYTIPEAPKAPETAVDTIVVDTDPCSHCTPAEQTIGYPPTTMDSGASQPAIMDTGLPPFDFPANLDFLSQTMMITPAADDVGHAFSDSTWFPSSEPHNFYWNMVQSDLASDSHPT
jgi:hypothetical protein